MLDEARPVPQVWLWATAKRQSLQTPRKAPAGFAG
jgi:hypothetical protein